jgi:hypothetical protein
MPALSDTTETRMTIQTQLPETPPVIAAAPRAIVFIDGTVPDIETLLAGLAPGIEAVMLDPTRDGLAQMAAHLAGRTDLEAVHVVSHGRPGALSLGTATLSAESLAARADDLAALGAALGEDGDLRLYGCDVGQGAEGRAFVEALAEATGADVAASDDRTGAADLGGDWDLEVAQGAVESAGAFTAEATAGYGGVLSVYDFSSVSGANTATVTQDIAGDILKATVSYDKLLTSTLSSGGPVYLLVGGDGPPSFQITLNDGALFSVGDIVWLSGETKTYEIAGWIGQTEDASTFVGTMDATGTFNALSGTYDRLVFTELNPGVSNISLFLNTIDLTPKFDTVAPILNTNAAKTLAEGATAALSNTNLAATDNLYGAADITYTVTAGPSNGTLHLDGVGGALDGIVNEPAVNAFTQKDLDDGKVLYLHDGSETTSDSFTVRLSDPKPNTSATATFNLSITPVNDLPQLGGTPADTTVAEDVTTAIDLSAYDVSDAEGDSVTLTLAVDRGTVATTDGNGLTDGVLVEGSDTASMILVGNLANLNTYLNDSSKITYTTAVNQTVAATLTVTPNDSSEYGSADTVTITVTPVNDAPVLNPAYTPIMTAIDMNAGDDDGSGADGDDDATKNTNNAGDSVAAIVADGSITDVDGGAVEAIAVTSVDNTNGVWQFSTDNGTSWIAFSGTTGASVDLTSAARLLDGSLTGGDTHKIRFVPDADYVGTASITFHAWDKSSGSAGGTADASSTGDTTAFSSASDTASLTINAINEAPTFTGLDGTPAFTEGGAAVVLDGDVTVSDTELDARNAGAGNYAGASLTIARSGGAIADDSFSIQTGGSLTVAGPDISSGGNVFATLDTTTTAGQVTVSFTDANSTTPTTALVNEVLQAIRYENASGDPPASVDLAWSFADGNTGPGDQGAGDAPGTGSGAVTVTISSVNQAPTLSATGDDPAYTEGGGGASLFSSANADAGEPGDSFAGLTLTVTNVTDGAAEILSIDGTDVALTDANSVTVAGGTAAVSLSGTTATVTVTGLDRTQAQFEALVNGLAYRNTSDDPTTDSNRVVTITRVQDSGGTANGGADATDTAIASTVTLTPVNDPPEVGNVFGETSTLVAGTVAQNVALFDDATVSNPDSADYDGGSLTITQDSGTANGSWGLDGTTATAGGDGTVAAGEAVVVGGVSIGTVDGTNNGQGGNALQVSFNADATSARIQTLFQALTYSAPSGLDDRGFTLTLNDGGGTATGGDQDTSGTFTISVTQDPPVIANLNGDTTAAGNGATVAFDLNGDATVTDADSVDFDDGALILSRTSSLAGDFSLDTSKATSGADGVIEASESIVVDGVAIGVVNIGGDGQGTNGLAIDLNGNATPVHVATLLQALQYASTDAGAHTFDVTLSDGGSAGAATSAVSSVTVSVEAVPVNTVPGAQTAVDGTAKAITGVSVADADSATLTTTVSVNPGDGTLTASGGGTITGAGTGSLQIQGSVAQVNAALATLSYTPAVDSTGAQTITVATTDGTYTDTDTISVTVSDRPTIANLNGDRQTLTAVATLPLDLGGDAAVTDADSTDFNGGTLTIARAGTAAAGNFSLDGTTATAGGDGALAAAETVSVSGTDIGTVSSAGQGTDALVIDLTASATPVLVGTLLQNILFTPDGVTTHTFDVTVSDGDGTTSEAARVTFAPPAPAGGGGGGGGSTGSTGTTEGTTVTTTTTTRSDGTVIETIEIAPFDGFDEGETDADGDGLSDHVVSGSGPGDGITAGLPEGFGLTAEGPAFTMDPATGALEFSNGLRILLGASLPADLTAAVQSYFGGADGAFWMSTLTPTFIGDGTPGSPLVVDGGEGGDANTAVIIDARDLPPGTPLILNNIGFAIVLGDVEVSGGEGSTFAAGGDGGQVIVLGPGDDTLLGGDGDDTVGSNGGDDLLVGGAGNDTLTGGDGVDTAEYAGAFTAATISRGAVVTVTDDGGTDTIGADVELLAFVADRAVTLVRPEGNALVAGMGFDPDFYLAQNADVAAAVEAGAFASAADHFQSYGLFEGRAGNALFSAEAYLAMYPDVAAAVEAGALASAQQHYAQYGAAEGRDPSGWFDASAYLEANPDVAAAGLPALEHFIVWGAEQGRVGIILDDGLLVA